MSGPRRPSQTASSSSPNRLLAALPAADYQRLLPSLRTVPVKFGQVIQKAGERIQTVYFPGGGVVSITTVMEDGRMVEVTSVGNEGLVGIVAFLGGTLASGEALVQVPDGAVLQALPVEVFKQEVERRGALFDLANRYSQAHLSLVMQSTACNCLHSVEQRCCRWLLMTHDRVGQDDFQLTQEFLAVMLGVRRPTITQVVGALQKAGLIRSSRRRIKVINRKGLERSACECYRVVKAHFVRLLP